MINRNRTEKKIILPVLATSISVVDSDSVFENGVTVASGNCWVRIFDGRVIVLESMLQ